MDNAYGPVLETPDFTLSCDFQYNSSRFLAKVSLK